MDWFARLLTRLVTGLGLRRPAAPCRRTGRRAGRRTGAVRKAGRAARAGDRQITRIERSVTTTWLPSGRKKRRTTSEWRHGSCPVRHRSHQAAARCRKS